MIGDSAANCKAATQCWHILADSALSLFMIQVCSICTPCHGITKIFEELWDIWLSVRCIDAPHCPYPRINRITEFTSCCGALKKLLCSFQWRLLFDMRTKWTKETVDPCQKRAEPPCSVYSILHVADGMLCHRNSKIILRDRERRMERIGRFTMVQHSV